MQTVCVYFPPRRFSAWNVFVRDSSSVILSIDGWFACTVERIDDILNRQLFLIMDDDDRQCGWEVK